ncbi:hypothetical protein B7H23_07830 [Notoacmeibacter marinus]|uniref:HAD family hydrolase n=1 Tax=Notoacmeibacter marinus TaxID=1876515 RepID=A0A231V3P9_9HYPH|nr:TIGR01459 family HAD-type hydrolase [Notoacmeibacter marinus]OXT02767.1 hypothetical protein B7H23_07830 [Notoacmeibacter marinus]
MIRFANLLTRYDGFIFDQYGVLHDGQKQYPGAVEALGACAAAGKPVVLVTNSGRTADANAERLHRLGYDPSLFAAIVTSGDLAVDKIEALAPRAVFTIARGSEPVRGVAHPTSDAAKADLLLIAGSEADRVSEADYRAMLQPLVARDVAALCSNPDLQMLTEDGLKPGAGQIAAWYEEMGGRVTYVGKPWPQIYEAAERALGLRSGRRICCVGDSMHHDIAGAGRAGLSSALVLTGISAALHPDDIGRMARDDGLRPTHVLRSLA